MLINHLLSFRLRPVVPFVCRVFVITHFQTFHCPANIGAFRLPASDSKPERLVQRVLTYSSSKTGRPNLSDNSERAKPIGSGLRAPVAGLKEDGGPGFL
jgi:hypothetical protein